MTLAMIEEDLDRVSALKVARGLVLFLKRPGGQSQFSVELRRQMHDARGRFDDLHDWIRKNLDGDLSVPVLARVAAMSPATSLAFILVRPARAPLGPSRRFASKLPFVLLESTTEPIKRLRIKSALAMMNEFAARF